MPENDPPHNDSQKARTKKPPPKDSTDQARGQPAADGKREHQAAPAQNSPDTRPPPATPICILLVGPPRTNPQGCPRSKPPTAPPPPPGKKPPAIGRPLPLFLNTRTPQPNRTSDRGDPTARHPTP
uniref:Uncharacterized protein n=1 Tax=Measles morbillivirus TaxID=11234 RepID=Q84187_9MONO|nr:unknown protein [Measles morbillivirus]